MGGNAAIHASSSVPASRSLRAAPPKALARGHNAGVKVHCCICLNQGRNVTATTTIHGYSVCAAHVDLVSQPEFDIFALRGGRETRGTAV